MMPEQATEPPDVLADFRRQGRLRAQAGHKLAQPGCSFLHQLRDIDPQRIILHLHRLIELEGLGIEMEAQPGEGLGVSIEELRRLAAHHAVERGHALLTIQQELHHAGGQRAITAMRRRLGFGGPNEQATHRTAKVERREQLADLVAVPDIAALELGQGHVAAVDVVEDGGDFHNSLVLPVSSSCIMPCLRAPTARQLIFLD